MKNRLFGQKSKLLTARLLATSISTAMLLCGLTAQAQLLIAPTVKAYSSQTPYAPWTDRAASYAVNGSGLTAGPSGVIGAADSTGGSAPDGGMWMTVGSTQSPNDLDPSITFDLGAIQKLQTTRIWNYNEAGFTFVGAQSILLSTSVDGTNFTELTALSVAQAGGGPADIAQDFATAATSVRYVRMQILSNFDGAIFWSSLTGTNHGGADGRYLTGLSEVRFVVATTLPVIWQHPQSQTLQVASSASFTVNASDSGLPPLSYRWRKNGTFLTDAGSITGSTSSNLVINAISLADQGYYDVVVANSQTSVTSQVAHLFIGGSLITPSINALSSEYNSGGIQRLAANLVSGAGMSGPGYFTDTHGRAEEEVWHHGPGDTDPFITFDLGGYYNLLIARYWNLNQASGTANGAKNVRLSVSADNATFTILETNTLARAGGSTAEPAQDFPAIASSIRYVKIQPLDGYGGGWNGLSAVRFEGTAVATPLPNITTQPVGSTNLPGESVTFFVVAEANGHPPLSYRWQKNGQFLVSGGNISGALTDTLVVSSVTGGDAGSYSVIVSNTVAGLSSVPAFLQVVLAPSLRISSRSGGQLITPSISAFSSEIAARLATNLVSGAGITGPGYYSDTHNNAAVGWGGSPGDAAPSVTFDLGATHDLLITRIWNYNSPGYAGAGAKDVRVSVSADNVTYTIVRTNTLVIAGGTSVEPAQDFSTAAAGIRYVRLEPVSGYGGAEQALGAVRFVVADPARPALLTTTLQGIPGLHYQLQFGESLNDLTGWQTLDIPALPTSPYAVPAVDGLVTTNGLLRFYRAAVVWP